jgi:L-threonylcarbamoyladenylate synthase
MILQAIPENITKAAEEIKRGNIVAFPTETVYGLGADALNPIAVSKIFEAKNRPSFNPLIVHLHEHSGINEVCEYSDERIDLLIEKFWPGPLTIVLPKKNIIPDIVTAGHETVAVRMPDHEVALELIRKSGTPVAAPSANTFGFLSPTSATHVNKQLEGRVDIILDGGDSNVGVESTIIQLADGKFKLLRPGGLPKEEIELITGTVAAGEGVMKNPNAPGQLMQHYAPNVPIKFIDEILTDELAGKKICGLFFTENTFRGDLHNSRILSPSGELHEAAANLFKYLHELEQESPDIIVAEKLYEEGLGIAIMDRLRKAVNKYNLF